MSLFRLRGRKDDEEEIDHQLSNQNNNINNINVKNVISSPWNSYNMRRRVKLEFEAAPPTTVGRWRWIKYYSSCHRILLVGEGDFSFSTCLATAFVWAPNMIATSFDSQDFLMKNYRNALSNIAELKNRNCNIMHEIDATTMATHHFLGNMKFDRIIFNFPYAGFYKNLSRQTQLREWNIESVASLHWLGLIEAVDFNHLDYPGYNTKCGFGGDNNFNCYPSKTYKFRLMFTS
ncbi:hypothetical protein RD792_002579 [Penstemon davidsonii]|uniref:25S rRNA (uridine-N(3))-methyltransferase BMT5-like domain-containing protein n=1 Tax=Penstemon davidsonii TaxID=160366 RepID=A0ABR0DSL2_9LAMI|nr:hypothetical protein RD792_002579 [Penstemon davidsonii]